MNNGIIKRLIFFLLVVIFIFSMSACKTMKAAVGFNWGKKTEGEHHFDAYKAPKTYPSASYPARG